MQPMISLCLLLSLLLWSPAARAADEPKQLIEKAVKSLAQGNLSAFSPELQQDIRSKNLPAQVKRAGPIISIDILDSVELNTGKLVQGRSNHASSVFYWTIGYSAQSQLIETLEVNRAAKTAGLYRTERIRRGGRGGGGRGGGFGWRAEPSTTVTRQVPTTTGMKISALPEDGEAACRKYASLCQDKDKDVRIVEFLFATTRSQSPDRTQQVSFTGSRGRALSFGAAKVRIPEKHEIGHIELPGKIGFWGFTLYETKLDPAKHFAIKSVVKLEKDDWGDLISASGANEALVFVHGYNTSFEDALYRNAQIIWDLQYKRGPSILFTWASKGQTLDYVYDQQSALIARKGLLDVLKMLRDDYKIEKINILAHSMGNLVVLDALASEERTQNPIRIAELMLAAPDVDRDYFLQIAPNVRKIVAGMTLYCSSADKAMIASRTLAGVPRAGDVPSEGPIILPSIETIDVTAMGQEILGLNHDTFATNRSVMGDIRSILNTGIRPPDIRGEMRGVPEGSARPTYWRYPN